MGRKTEGFRIRPHDGVFHVRFTHEWKRHERTTGERDPARAQVRAAQIYAEVVSGRWEPAPGGSGALPELDAAFANWLAALSADRDAETVKSYKWMVKRKFMPFFGTLDRITKASLGDYARARLRKVTRGSVIKELSALSGFLTWCVESGVLRERPANHELPERAVGVRSGTQRTEVVALTPEEVARILTALPEWSFRTRGGGRGKPYRVRDYFLALWETGLRPGTIARLAVPTHYRHGEDELRIADDIDKARYGRTVTLTPSAVAVLSAACPDVGLIFGDHARWRYLKVAAKAAGIVRWADVAPYDLRHGRATDFLEASGSLQGTAYQLGHKRVTTTNKYARPNARAGSEVVRKLGLRGKNGGSHMATEAKGREKTPESSDDRLDRFSHGKAYAAQQIAGFLQASGPGEPGKGAADGDSGGLPQNLATVANGLTERLSAEVAMWNAYDAFATEHEAEAVAVSPAISAAS